jgi:antitoxin MazE
MRTRIRKWGNSLGVRIPSALAEDAHLHEGAEVEVTIREGQLVIVPVLSLAELVAGITASNLPELDAADAPRGGELW